jgi:hypothetical protein
MTATMVKMVMGPACAPGEQGEDEHGRAAADEGEGHEGGRVEHDEAGVDGEQGEGGGAHQSVDKHGEGNGDGAHPPHAPKDDGLSGGGSGLGGNGHGVAPGRYRRYVSDGACRAGKLGRE